MRHVGQPWHEVASERIRAGEDEVKVMADYGYVRPAECRWKLSVDGTTWLTSCGNERGHPSLFGFCPYCGRRAVEYTQQGGE